MDQAEALKLGVEPYLGYGEFSYSARASTDSTGGSDSQTGPLLGGKGGVFLSEKFWVALDYHLGGPYNLENNEVEYLNRMWGVGIGAIKKNALRAWVGYYYSNELDDTETGAIFKGRALKASVGYAFQDRLSINLEFSKQEFSEVRSQGQTLSTPSTLDVSGIYLTLSSPLQLN